MSVVRIVVGLVLVLLAVRQWRSHENGNAETDALAWMRKLDTVTMTKAADLAVLFVVKPKNLLLTIGAGVAVAQVGASPAGQAAAVCVFVALGTAGLGIPLAIRSAAVAARPLLIGRAPDLGWATPTALYRAPVVLLKRGDIDQVPRTA